MSNKIMNPGTGNVTLVVELSPLELAAAIKYIGDIPVMKIDIEDVVDLRKALLSMKETWKEYLEL